MSFPQFSRGLPAFQMSTMMHGFNPGMGAMGGMEQQFTTMANQATMGMMNVIQPQQQQQLQQLQQQQPQQLQHQQQFTIQPIQVQPIQIQQQQVRPMATSARQSTSAAPPVVVPPLPKKPLSAYLLFATERRPALIQENPGMSPTDAMRRLGAAWKELDEREKQQYQLRAKEALDAHNKIRNDFLSNLTPEQKKALRDQPNEKKLRQAKRKLSALEKELCQPTPPGNGYIFFVKENQQSGVKADFSSLAAKWKALSDEEKRSYNERAGEAQRKYKEDLAAWKDRVMKSSKGEEMTFLKDSINQLKSKLHVAE